MFSRRLIWQPLQPSFKVLLGVAFGALLGAIVSAVVSLAFEGLVLDVDTLGLCIGVFVGRVMGAHSSRGVAGTGTFIVVGAFLGWFIGDDVSENLDLLGIVAVGLLIGGLLGGIAGAVPRQPAGPECGQRS